MQGTIPFTGALFLLLDIIYGFTEGQWGIASACPPPGSDATAFADGKENKPGQYFVYRLPTRHTGQWSRRRPGVMKKAHSRLFIDSMYSAKDLKNIYFF